MKAFVLGAGLGTRLFPLTEERPKPLVPIFDRPLITFAFAHLAAAGVTEFVVNTHYRPEAWSEILGEQEGRGQWQGLPITFQYEPLLLDTGGGIKNCEQFLSGSDFWLHNGDVVADLPLEILEEEHRAQGNIATLALRSSGGPLHVAFNPEDRRVVDIRGKLQVQAPLACLYLGIACVSPRIFKYIESPQPASLIPILCQIMEEGERVGGILLDEGHWLDVGTVPAYKSAHQLLKNGLRLSYMEPDWPAAQAPSAELHPTAQVHSNCILGPHCRVGARAELEDCLLWPAAEVAAGVRLQDCIVRRFASFSAESTVL